LFLGKVKCDVDKHWIELRFYLVEANMKKMNKDLVGMRFGKLVVVKPTKRTKNGHQLYLCKYDCGKRKEVGRTPLRNGKTRSCGCLHKEIMASKIIDLTGQVFSFLTVLKIDKSIPYKDRAHKCVYWKCKCSCGKTKPISMRELRSGHTKSCGCQKNNCEVNRKYDPIESTARNVFRKYNDGNLTFEQFLILSQMICFYCGNPQIHKITIRVEKQ
jgi:hypothetical protein